MESQIEPTVRASEWERMKRLGETERQGCAPAPAEDCAPWPTSAIHNTCTPSVLNLIVDAAFLCGLNWICHIHRNERIASARERAIDVQPQQTQQVDDCGVWRTDLESCKSGQRLE